MQQLENLIDGVESSARWRSEKAAQYPGDTRNEHSAHALTKLAERLKALPENDENALAYEAIVERLVELEIVYRVSEEESAYIGRYGFDYRQDGDPAEFLAGITEKYQEWVTDVEEVTAEEEREQEFEAASEAADEAAKEAADETAKEAAEEAAKEAADEAYKEAYDEAYKEAYDEAYREALIEALDDAA